MKNGRSHRSHRSTSRLAIEHLEPRLVRAGVVINEFLAENAHGLLDQDGDASDWIELKNTDAAPVDITGWYLTDDAAIPTKWQLPNTVLAPGQALTIFASDKNRAVAGQELHTNFKLGSAGEYLGLLKADGATVAYDFGPAYPAQFEDISYGTGVTEASSSGETLVGDGTSLSVISPTGANQARDDHWREVGYSTTGWLTGTGSVGFDRNSDGINLSPYINRVLTLGEMDSTDATPQFSAYVRYQFDVANKEQLTSLQMDARFDDGMIVYLNGQEIARANFAEDFQYTQPQWNSFAGHQQGSNGNASAYNRTTESLDLVTWNLTPFLSLLVDQGNVLAFHLVNSNSGTITHRQDLFVDPVLSTTRATGSSQIGYLALPTPGRTNGLSTLGFVEDTQFSHDRGFYDTAFNLSISTPTAGATIRYTTDGSVPSLSNGTTYVGPISIDPNTIPNGERGVVMIRAAAFKDGWTATNVDTQSYVFLSKVILQNGLGLPATAPWGTDGPDADAANGFQLDTDEFDWAMDPDIVGGLQTTQEVIDALKTIPTVSLVTDWSNLWSGAAKPGTPPQNWNGNARTAFEPEGIYIHGRSDERPASMEFFNADGSQQFQIDAAVEIQGHSSGGRWNSDKLSFQVKFKEPYGDPELNQALFSGTADGANAVTKFDTLVLDAGYNYIWNHNTVSQRSFARFVTDQVVSDLQNLASGATAAHGKYVHVYIDGVYWGLYDMHERPDEHYAAEYYGGNDDDYYVVKHSPNDIDHHYSWANGGVAAEDAFALLLAASQTARNNPTSLAAYEAVADILDVDEFIDYIVVHMYGGNETDWPHNNWYATYNHVDPDGKWRFHAWDQEHAFATTDNGDAFTELSDPTDFGSEDADGPGDIIHDLILNNEFRLRFSDRVQKLMHNGGLLTEAKAQEVYEARLDEIYDAIIAESARWGDNRVDADPYTRQDWIDVNIDDTTGDMKAVVPDFFPARTNSVLSSFDTAGWLQLLDAPVFNNYGGTVAQGFDVTIAKPVGSPVAAEIYYTTDGSDPRLAGGTANPAALHGAGPVSIDIDAAKNVKARIKNGTEWSAIIDAQFSLPDPFPLRITEVHYNPAAFPGVSSADDLEFIELMNASNHSISLDGVQLTTFVTPAYTFDSGITLAAGERIVVARTPSVFQSVYGTAIKLAPTGYGTGNLSNGGEQIAVVGTFGGPPPDFTYDDIAPWPTSPDGGGTSLEIINPLGDPTNPANWRASASAGGSPGTETTPAAGDYDRNGIVQQADYAFWVSRFGQTVTPTMSADGSKDGTINSADYVLWRKALSNAGSGGGGEAAAAASGATETPAVLESAIALVHEAAAAAQSPPLGDTSRAVAQSANYYDVAFAATESPSRSRRFALSSELNMAARSAESSKQLLAILIDRHFETAYFAADFRSSESTNRQSERSEEPSPLARKARRSSMVDDLSAQLGGPCDPTDDLWSNDLWRNT